MANPNPNPTPSPNPRSTTTSSLSSRKFALNEADPSPILVYQLRAGYAITSQKDLCKTLDASATKQRCSRKPIPKGCSRLEIQTRDLFNEPEKSRYAHFPNARSSLASVGLPRSVFWRRLLMGQFKEIFIVSPDHSPEGSSRGDSPVDTEDFERMARSA